MSSAATAKLPPQQLAEQNWQRYQYAKRRGHTTYVAQAVRCEAFYLGAGGQWADADRLTMRESGNRPAYEYNEIMPAVNGAVGYQIHNRMDITFLPRGGMADTNLATIRSKVARQIMDHSKFHWKETQVFFDGTVEQRGYFDFRMCFDENVFGDLDIDTLDPRDVVPDPDAKSYDPKDWGDVCILRWYTKDEITGRYGKAAGDGLQLYIDSDSDWGEQNAEDGPRNKFGDEGIASQSWDSFLNDADGRKFRVIDRQRWIFALGKVAIYPTGDVKQVDDALPEQLAEYKQQGAVITKRLQRKVHWTVTTRWNTLFDSDSPYDRFTVVPYFFIFRRGKTRGMVDNAISPQETLNKALSQCIHIVNTTANSGWIVEQNSLTNMTTDTLKQEGSKSGFVLEYKQGSTPPEKIKPNDIPAGMDHIIDRAYTALKSVTVPDAMRGIEDDPISGIASQVKQYAAQSQLAIPLDNLARTRHMCADWLDYAISNFYDNARQFRITETDPNTGKEVTTVYDVNHFNPTSKVWENDLTEGDYDVVVSDEPMQVTFENSQFEQVMEMRDKGVKIPDNVIIKHSNLQDKADILSQMEAQGDQPTPSEQAEIALNTAKTSLASAQADKTQADTANTRVTSLFAAAQTGQVIATMPAIAPLADAIAKSAGVQDMDAPPEIPTPAAPVPALPAPGAVPAPAPGAPGFAQNPNPLAPAHPAVGADKGIEGGGK